MKKRIGSILLVGAVLFSLVITAFAVEPRTIDITPTLSFDGTTATCSISIMSFGKTINATLELWQGSTRVAQWSDSATSRLIISEECSVTKGKTYTLKVSGTIDSEEFTGTPISRTC